MFHTIEVENFRKFRRLSVGPLRRVNLVTGGNGSGKTSFLEAIFLLAGGSNATLAVSLYNFRNESVMGPKVDRMFRSIFRDLKSDRPVALQGVGGFQNSSGQSESRKLRIEGVAADYATVNGENAPSLSGLRFIFEGPSGAAEAVSNWEVIEEVSESGEAKSRWRFGRTGEMSKDLVKSYFVSPYYRELWQQSHDLLTKATKSHGVPEIVEWLQLVEPSLRNILPLSEAGVEVIYVDLGGDQLLPLSVLGSGFVHLLHLLLQASSLKHGCLFIDEIEDGLHYSLVGRVLEILIGISVKNDLQVFITTHSREVLERFGEAAQNLEFDDVSLVRLARDQGDVIAHVLDLKDLIASQEVDVEVR